MPILVDRATHASAAGDGRALLLGSLVGVAVLIAAMLAVEGVGAARSHRLTADRALHDYASVAGREAAAATNREVEDAIAVALAPVAAARASSPYDVLAAPAVLPGVARDVLRCPAPDPRSYFRVDFRDGSVASAGAPLPAATAAWLAAAIPADVRVRGGDARVGVVEGPSSLGGSVAAYALKSAQFGAPLAAFGFTTCSRALAGAVARVVASHALLPSSVSGGVANDSLLVVTAGDGGAIPWYRSSAAAGSAYTATASAPLLPGIVIGAALRADAAARLLVGPPREHDLMALSALLALTIALALVAARQLRREHELARLRAYVTARVSHELRTPLAQILLFAETLSLGRARSEGERRFAAETIVREARRLMTLVDGVLHVGRAEAGAHAVARPVALAALVRRVVGDFEPLARAQGAVVDLRLDEDVMAATDPEAVRQILLNLLDNALKHGPPGQRLRVAVERGGRVARLSVEDEGPGVAVPDRERVWFPFVRGSGAGSGGSGLGLAIVRELALLQGGRAWLTDASGRSRGARVVVELPAAAAVGAA